MTAIILGYYDKNNLGDEQYKLTFPSFLKRCGFRGDVRFVNPHDLVGDTLPADTRLVVVGGGDVINDWFYKKLDRVLARYAGPVFALSIGITYPSTITQRYFGRFRYVVMRHAELMDDVARVVGPGCVASIPDLGFTLTPRLAARFPRRRIGVFAARGIETAPLRDALDRLKCDPTHTYRYDIVMYSMNTSDLEHEGDRYAAAELASVGRESYVIHNVAEMMQQIAGCHITICVRYHAHVFSIVQHTPFVSYATKPKTQYLMRDFGFTDNVYTPEDSTSDRIDADAFYQRIAWTLDNRDALVAKIETVHREILDVVQTFTIPLTERNAETVADECDEMLRNGADADAVVSHALYHTTGEFDNKYRYGFVENVRSKAHDIREMVKWVDEDHRRETESAKFSGFRFVQRAQDFAGVHRSGWEAVARHMRQFENPRGILTDLYMDATFHWNRRRLVAEGVLPYRQRWIGFLHHTPDAAHSRNSASRMFRNRVFLQSLRYCRAIVCLSQYLAGWTRRALDEAGYTHVRVETLVHPTEQCELRWRLRNWLDEPTVTQIGAWLRNPYAIYSLRVAWGRKQVLVGRKMEGSRHPDEWFIANRNRCTCHSGDRKDDCRDDKSSSSSSSDSDSDSGGVCRPPRRRRRHGDHDRRTAMTRFMTRYCREEFGVPRYAEVRAGKPCCIESGDWSANDAAKVHAAEKQLQTNYASVAELRELSNDEYDRLMQRTVVFLELTDCSAANTIIESIVRHTPVIVNRLPAVEEYLGERYPLLYTNTGDVWRLVNPTKVLEAFEYLKRRDKYRLTFDAFTRDVEALMKRLAL